MAAHDGKASDLYAPIPVTTRNMQGPRRLEGRLKSKSHSFAEWEEGSCQRMATRGPERRICSMIVEGTLQMACFTAHKPPVNG